jgi:hypothetical protein
MFGLSKPDWTYIVKPVNTSEIRPTDEWIGVFDATDVSGHALAVR